VINLLLLKVLSSYVDDVGLVIGGFLLNSDSYMWVPLTGMNTL
jgi:hypothetical protein